ncbi:MAG: hypothetical protein ACRC8O_00180 [Plesiomonas shigelloides]
MRYARNAISIRTKNAQSPRWSINAAMLSQETINEATVDKGVFDEMAFVQVSK